MKILRIFFQKHVKKYNFFIQSMTSFLEFEVSSRTQIRASSRLGLTFVRFSNIKYEMISNSDVHYFENVCLSPIR